MTDTNHKKRKYTEEQIAAKKEYNRLYRQANRERLDAYQALYRDKNKESLSEKKKEYYKSVRTEKLSYNKKYYESNRSELLSKNKLYAWVNKEKISEYMRAYRQENKEILSQKKSEYLAKNPELKAFAGRSRRARKRAAYGSHSPSDIKSIFSMQKGLCATCTEKLVTVGLGKYHVDHIVPLALGGSNGRENLQCLCPSCNFRKGSKDPLDWAKINGKLI